MKEPAPTNGRQAEIDRKQQHQESILAVHYKRAAAREY